MLPGENVRKKNKINIWWLRRDLRLFDNAAMVQALRSGRPVLPLFIFDKHILNRLPDSRDRRVTFIYRQLQALEVELEKKNSALLVIYDTPEDAFRKLCERFDIKEVFTNRDYEPYAKDRDLAVASLLGQRKIHFHSYKDQVIFDRKEVLKADGSPYTVFTSFSRKWKDRFYSLGMAEIPKPLYRNFFRTTAFVLPSLEEIGFKEADLEVPSSVPNEDILGNYQKKRDIPGVEGTTRLGVHLRFGTVSIRQIINEAARLNEAWLNELIWREFFMMILDHFPEVEYHNFKRKYDRLEWRNNEKEFELWCRGETGYPLVDAGMRQLNETGWMHNRVRMVVAGFLTKHLLIDWRWGEAYFSEKLLDYELASNNGNWQWAAGTGCDAVPYFRIFNPETQLKKFDPDLKYVRRWIKNREPGYLPLIVEHTFARQRALETYKRALHGL